MRFDTLIYKDWKMRNLRINLELGGFFQISYLGTYEIIAVGTLASALKFFPKLPATGIF